MIGRQYLFKLAASLVLAFWIQLGSAWAEVKPTFIDVPTFTSALEQALIQGVQSTSNVLNRLGPDVEQALRDAQEKSDFKYYQFSARSQIEMLYQRAEAGGAGQGNLFLARLKDSLSVTSAAVADDPRLKFLDSVPRQAGQQIAFANIATMDGDALRNSLSPAVDEALTILSEHTASKGIGHVRGVLIRNLNLDPSGKEPLRKFDDIVRKATSIRDVLAAAVIAHTPPPKPQIAVQQMIQEFASESGAFAVDPAVARVINGLSTELTVSEQRLMQSDRNFQAAHSSGAVSPPAVADSNSDQKVASAISEAIEHAPENIATGSPGVSFPQSVPDGGDRLTQKHQDYIEQSFAPRKPGGYSAPLPVWYPGPRLAPVPRAYKIAILSARAARGIAVGAEMKDGVGRLPLKAYWISDKSNDRFGRLVVAFASCKENWAKFMWQLLKRCDGEPLVATSKRLHSDSFMAANQLLWGTYKVETQFTDGDITVLMSMNPFLLPDSLTPLYNDATRLIDKYKTLVRSYNDAATSESRDDPLSSLNGGPFGRSQLDFGKMSRFGKQGQLITDKKLDDLKKQLQQTEDQINSVKKKIDDTESANFRNGEAPSAIVFHPAVQGRSLAWSAARTDFWFNNTERLFEEAKAVETEDGVAYDMRRIFEASKRGANTWQFFERDGTIELARVDSKTVLTVRADGDLGEDGRFAVSLFQVEGSNEDQARRLSEQESNIKRPIAWLERTHPDFWRLSDFSTSLMYLRYLKAHEIQLISFSQDDFDPKLATPEWIYKRTGEPVVRP